MTTYCLPPPFSRRSLIVRFVGPVMLRSMVDAWTDLPSQCPSFRARPTSAAAARTTRDRTRRRRRQVNPNHAPHAASSLIHLARDHVYYEQHLGSMRCRGTSLMESCIIDHMRKTWIDQ